MRRPKLWVNRAAFGVCIACLSAIGFGLVGIGWPSFGVALLTGISYLVMRATDE